MNRQAAIQLLYAATGTGTPSDLCDALQDRGLIADEVIEPARAATEDLCAAAKLSRDA